MSSYQYRTMPIPTEKQVMIRKLINANLSVKEVMELTGYGKNTVERYGLSLNNKGSWSVEERQQRALTKKNKKFRKIMDNIHVGDHIQFECEQDYHGYKVDKHARLGGLVIYSGDGKIIVEVSPHRRNTYTVNDMVAGNFTILELRGVRNGKSYCKRAKQDQSKSL